MAVDNGVPLLVGHFLDDVIPGESGVVDDNVDATERVQCRFNATLAEIRRCDVTDAGSRFPPHRLNLRNDFVSRLLVQVIDDDPGSLTGELQRHTTSDATAGTGDNGHFAFERLTHETSPVSGW
ncbi:hypothetical protein D3C81_1829500 [compost metagenome]